MHHSFRFFAKAGRQLAPTVFSRIRGGFPQELAIRSLPVACSSPLLATARSFSDRGRDRVSVGPAGISASNSDFSNVSIDAGQHHHYPPAVKALSLQEASNVVVPGGVDALYPNGYQQALSSLLENHRIVCVHGAGGCGKSILAQGEALNSGKPYTTCYQFDAHSDSALLSGLEGLYHAFFGRESLNQHIQKESDEKVQAQQILSRINAHIKEVDGTCLFILDNCSVKTLLMRLLIDQLTSSRIVITTRDATLLEEIRGVARLSLQKGWRQDEKMQFLTGLGSKEECEALAEYLPFPLALEVASRTIKRLRGVLARQRRKQGIAITILTIQHTFRLNSFFLT